MGCPHRSNRARSKSARARPGVSHFSANSAWCVSSWASRSSFHRSKSRSPTSSGVSLIERRNATSKMNLTDGVSRGIRGLYSRASARSLRGALHPIRGPLPGKPVPRDHVDDTHADIHRVVRNSLQVAVHQDVPRARFDLQAPFRHPSDKLVEVLVMHPVDIVVDLHDVPHGFRVMLDERVDRRVDHLDGAVRHLSTPCEFWFCASGGRTELKCELP